MSALYSWGLGRPRLCLLLDHFCGKSSYYPHSDPKHRGGHSSSANAAWNLGALLSMMVLPEGWTPSPSLWAISLLGGLMELNLGGDVGWSLAGMCKSGPFLPFLIILGR